MKRFKSIPGHKSRWIKAIIGQRLLRINAAPDLVQNQPYKYWMSGNEPDKSQLEAMKTESKAWPFQPRISIITPVYNTEKYSLTECIKSVLDQVYDNWELCLVDGGSDKSYVKKMIEKYAKRDRRIKYTVLSHNPGIAGNSNEALKLATGDYIGFLDHDDMLAPFALYEVVKFLNENSGIDFIYSDEDKVPAEGGERYEPFFKPDWSPDTFLSYNYLCHFAVVKRSIIEKIGGFREGYDGAHDYDLILRVVQNTNNIIHIPRILYHRRADQGSTASQSDAEPYATAASKKAIAEYLQNKGREADVVDGLFPNSYRVKYKIRPLQKVCIIIPTKDKVQFLRNCISSILEKTEYQDYEIVIVDNQSQEQETIDYFETLAKLGIKSGARSGEMIRVLSYDQAFNYSAINNFAVKHTNADYLLFLNNDTEVITPEWLSAMLEFAQRTDVGAVGAKLLYPDGTIQHAGVIIGLGEVASHSHRFFPGSSHGYMGRINIIQNLSAVTAACMLIRKTVFEEAGGFDERMSHAFNDIDLCLKIRERGYLIVYTPYAELFHHESASRGQEDTPERKARYNKDVELMQGKWKHIIQSGDQYYNPNLTLNNTDCSIRL